MNQSTN